MWMAVIIFKCAMRASIFFTEDFEAVGAAQEYKS